MKDKSEQFLKEVMKASFEGLPKEPKDYAAKTITDQLLVAVIIELKEMNSNLNSMASDLDSCQRDIASLRERH